MRRKPLSRWLFLRLFLMVMAFGLLEAPLRLHGHWERLPLYMASVAVGFVLLILAAFIGAVRKRRLWIDDREAHGLRTYEQPRDTFSNNPLVRRILFLPRRNPN
jgi:hypothetical protein